MTITSFAQQVRDNQRAIRDLENQAHAARKGITRELAINLEAKFAQKVHSLDDFINKYLATLGNSYDVVRAFVLCGYIRSSSGGGTMAEDIIITNPASERYIGGSLREIFDFIVEHGKKGDDCFYRRGRVRGGHSDDRGHRIYCMTHYANLPLEALYSYVTRRAPENLRAEAIEAFNQFGGTEELKRLDNAVYQLLRSARKAHNELPRR